MDNINGIEEKRTIADAAGLGDELTVGECMTSDDAAAEDLSGDVPKCERIIEAVLFAAGYFIGAVENKTQALKDVVNRAIPDKKPTPIDVRETVTREQENAFRAAAREQQSTEEKE